ACFFALRKVCAGSIPAVLRSLRPGLLSLRQQKSHPQLRTILDRRVAGAGCRAAPHLHTTQVALSNWIMIQLFTGYHQAIG
ncbi:MAG: hypothetical protein ACI9MJ_001120, partial [Alphaproteobacteria bacterium]